MFRLLKSLSPVLILGCSLPVFAGADNLWPDDGSFETGHSIFMQKAVRGDAVDGEYAMYVPPGEEVTGGYLAGILENGKTYVFSAWIKSPKATTVYPFLLTERYQYTAKADLQLEANVWKQVVFHIDSGPGNSIRFFIGKQAEDSLLVDGVKLALRDAGSDNATYSPTYPVTAGVLRHDGIGEILDTSKEPAKRLFRIRNNSGEKRAVQGTVTLEAPGFPDRELWKGEVELEAGKAFEKELEVLPETATGYYLVRTRVSDGKGAKYESAMPFIVTPPPRKTDDLFMGLHTWGGTRTRYKMIGCKAARDIISWAPTPFKDGFYQPAREIGFIQQMSMNVAGPPSHAEKNADGTATAAALDKFISDYFRNKPATVHYLDMENEPDLGWKIGKKTLLENAEHYAKYHKNFAKSVRKAMPNAKIGTAGVSGDDFNSGFPFVRRVIEIVGKNIDYLPIHPYAHARFMDQAHTDIGPEMNGTWAKTAEARSIVSKDTEIIFGEVGWALDVRCDLLSDPAIRHSQYLSRLFLISRALNVSILQWFLGDDHLERTYYHYGLWRNTLPLPSAAAYAATAQRLDGAKTVSVLENDAVYLYVFRDADGRLFAAGWTTDELPVEITLPFAEGSVELSDWLGRKLPVSGTEFELTQGPKYWIAKSGKDEVFLKALENRSVNRAPLSVHKRPVSRTKVAFDFENRGMKPFEGSLSFNGEQRKLKLNAPKSTGWQIQPVCATQEFKVRDSGAEMSLNILDQKGKRFTLKFGADPLLSLKGKLPVMDSSKWVLPNDPGIGYNGKDDLSIKPRFDWNKDNLILDLEVQDDVHDSVPKTVWAADSVQLAIDPKVNGNVGFDDDDYEFAFALHNGKVVTECFFAPKGVSYESLTSAIKATGERTGTVTRYHIEIPWSILKIEPKTGTVLAMNFVVNDSDADGRGRAYWMGLTPGIGEGKTPGVYRKFILEKDANGK